MRKVLAAGAVVVAALVASCTSSSSARVSTASATRPVQSGSLTPRPTARAVATAHPLARTVLDLPGPPTRLAVGGGAVFVLFGPSNVPQRVARFDPRTGSAVWGPVIKGAHDLAVAGGWLWVSGGGVLGYGRPATRFLYRLDPSTLEVLGRVVLPESAYPLAPSPAGMWVGANDALYLVDPRTGHIDRTIPLKGTVGQISVDEQTGILYDSTHPVGDATIQAVEERDLATGVLRLRSFVEKNELEMNSLAAVPDGVWTAYATGMLGSADLLDASDLNWLASLEATATNGIRADYANAILWVSDGMAGTLACADPATGGLRAQVSRPSGVDYGTSNVIAFDRAVFVGTLNGFLVRVDPGPRCLGTT